MLPNTDWTRFYGATFGDGTGFDGWTADRLRGWLVQRPAGRDADAAASAARIEARLKAARSGSFACISFAAAVFDGVSWFRNRAFEGPADFSGAVFRSVPDFAGSTNLGHCDLSEIAISFGGRGRSLRNWTTSGEIDTRLRRLRKVAKDVEAGDLERDLFILERKAQRGRWFARLFRKPDHPWREVWNRGRLDRIKLRDNLQDRNPLRPLGLTLWLFLYGVTSDCGRSMLRPLLWMAASFLGFLAAYREIHAGKCAALPLFHPDLVSFTLGNTLPFLGSLSPARKDVLLRLFRGAAPDQIQVPLAIELLSIAQSVLGAVLLFLLLLAIRNRFRLA